MTNLQYSAPLVWLTYDGGITRCHDGQVHLRSIASNMEDVRAPQLPPEFKVEQKWLKFQCRECDVNMLNRCNVESGRVNKSNHSWNVENRPGAQEDSGNDQGHHHKDPSSHANTNHELSWKYLQVKEMSEYLLSMPWKLQ